MILGAGAFQLPAIKKAQELGHKVICASYKESDIGLKEADVGYVCSTINKEELLKIAIKEKIDGITTIASEIAAPSVAYIAEKLGLIGYGYETASIIANKYRLRSFLNTNGLNSIKFGVATTLGEAIEVFEGLKKPAIIKPSTASGSVGVYKIYTKEELVNFFPIVKEASIIEKSVILEEFIEGREVGGEVLIVEGKIHLMAITKKYVNSKFVPYGHLLPCDIHDTTSKAIKTLLQSVINKLELKNGPLNFDIMIQNGAPHIIELGGRLGGNCLPMLMKNHTGTDTIKAIIELALGNSLDEIISYEQKPVAAYILHSVESGILARNIFDNIQNSYLEEFIVNKFASVAKGDKVEKFTRGACQLGYLIFNAETQNQLIELFNKVENYKWVELN